MSGRPPYYTERMLRTTINLPVIHWQTLAHIDPSPSAAIRILLEDEEIALIIQERLFK